MPFVKLLAAWAAAMVCPLAAIAAVLSLRIVDEHGRTAHARVRILDAQQQALPVTGLLPAHPNFPELGVIVPGHARISLPPGSASALIDRGPEYELVDMALENGEMERRIQLKRVVDMAGRGWWSGDLHVHRAPREMEALQQASDLHVAPPITCFNDTSQVRSWPANCEDERRWGAALFVGVRSPMTLYPRNSEYPPPGRTWQEARDRGAFIDLEKVIWWESPVMAALNPPDTIGVAVNHFLEDTISTRASLARPRDETKYSGTEGFGRYILDLYATYLSAGFRIPASAGSANGVAKNALGYNRSYVYLGRKFSLESWLSGQKAGRNFVTNGPMLSFTANDQVPGSVLPEGNTPIRIRLECESRSPLQRAEVVVDGEVVATFTPEQGNTRLHGAGSVRVSSGGWMVARCFEREPRTLRFAHTSPIYVGPTARRSPHALAFLREWVDAEIQRVERLPVEALTPPQKAEVLNLCRKARRRYE